MIEINLLLEEFKPRRQRLHVPQIPLIPIIGAGLGGLGIIYLGIFLLTSGKSAQLKKFEAVWKENESLYTEVSQLQDEMDMLRAQKTLLDQISGKGVLWARTLSTLSDQVPDEIWLTRLILNRDREPLQLKIQGFALDNSEKPSMDSIAQFIDLLKKDSVFMEAFRGVELGPVERVQDDKRSSVKFTLKMPLRQEGA